jgi:cell division protein FtsW
MTEMVYGSNPIRVTEPVLPRWWRTIDKWTLTSVFVLFGIGLLLGLAASVPLATRNGLEPFYYVQRQAFFGGIALVVMIAISMMSPAMVRRLGVMGFAVSLVALMLLPVLGTDFGKGAVRWFSLGFASIQPSEFLKPGFVIVVAWLIASAQDLNGPPGKTISFALTLVVVGFLAMQPDFGQSALIIFAWGVIYFIGGAPMK